MITEHEPTVPAGRATDKQLALEDAPLLQNSAARCLDDFQGKNFQGKNFQDKNFEDKNERQATDETLKVTTYIKICTWFTPYRQLFALALSTNLIIAALGLSNSWIWSLQELVPLLVGNIFVACFVRSEWVLRFIYWVAVKTFRPKVFPLSFRAKVVGLLYHIGGLHSGCGLSALLWQTVASYNYFRHAKIYNIGFLMTLGICQACLLVTCLPAFPVIRGPFHDFFEMTHRFVGWVGIISTILSVILGSLWDVEHQRWDSSPSKLLSQIQLWFLVAIFVIIVFSWITVAKVPVTVVTPTDKVSVIRFPGGLTSGLHTRISLGGLREWHIFGTISEGKTAECHYVVAAVQGEFTTWLNVEKPLKVYTKLWKPCGLPYFSRLFTRGLAMCTGSGIGAVASTCLQHEGWFLIWIGPNLEKTYGKELVQLIYDKIPPSRRLIWDTRGPAGRPDVVNLLQDLHNYWEAEVTLFIGNPAMNANVLRSCKALKIPVFGSIWDA